MKFYFFGGEIWSFDDDRSVSPEYVELSSEEIEKHLGEDFLFQDGVFVRVAVPFDDLMSAALANRAAAYKAESDPLYIEWQYDQSEEGEVLWRAKVLEIKERYPLPTEPEETE